MSSVRRNLVLLMCGLIFLVLNCGKKSTAPTSPPPPTPPACSVSTTALDFGTVLAGASPDRSFTVSRPGRGTLSGSVTTASPRYCVMAGNSFDRSSSQSATLTIRSTPPGNGAQPGTISLTPGSCGNVSCTANGQEP